jgi:hypothetical protein
MGYFGLSPKQHKRSKNDSKNDSKTILSEQGLFFHRALSAFFRFLFSAEVSFVLS